MLSAYEDGAHALEDAALLDRAQESGRVLFSRDDDLLREATRRQRKGISFSGVIYAHQREVSIGRCTLDLHVIAEASEPEELRDRVVFCRFNHVGEYSRCEFASFRQTLQPRLTRP